MTSFHISPDTKRRRCSNPANCKYGTALTIKPMKGGSYYGSTVDVAAITPILKAWGAHVGYKNAEAMLANKDERDGGRAFHVTLIDPKETRQLRKAGVDLSEIENGEVNAVPQGVGKQVDPESGNETWFITAESPQADALRGKLGLGEKDYHITLGFTQKDIHGVPKGESTVVEDIIPEETGADPEESGTVEDMETTTEDTKTQDPSRDVNVDITLDTLKPAEFDLDEQGNVVIPEGLRAKLIEEINAGYITPAESENGDFVMLKYSKTAMFASRWNETTVNFRGVLTDADYRRVYARGFTKFFNASEHEGRPAFPDLPKHEPVVLAKKMDGSLGLIADVNGENRVYTSGSSRRETNEIASIGEEILGEQLAERGQSSWKPPKNVTVLGEIVSPINRIVVDYQDARRLVVLGAVDNRTGLDIPEDELNAMVPLERVEKINNGVPMSYSEALTYPIPNEEEGYVLEFQESGLRAKVKGDTYLAAHKTMTNMSAKNLWETIVEGKDQELLDTIKQTAPDRAYLVVAQARDKMKQDVETQLAEGKSGAQKALEGFGVKSIADVPRERMGAFVGHMKAQGTKSDFSLWMTLLKGDDDERARETILKRMKPHGQTSIVSLVSAEESEVGDDADDQV